MYDYQFNIALNGHHYCNIRDNGMLLENQARELLADLKTRFPESEGFEVSCYQWLTTGKELK